VSRQSQGRALGRGLDFEEGVKLMAPSD